MNGATTPHAVFVGWKLAATAAFLLVNGFFVATEFALVKVRHTHMASLAKAGNRRARLVTTILHDLDLYLSACQLGITLASLILGWLAEPAVGAILVKGAAALGLDIAGHPWVHPVALALALAIITMAHMIVGEQAPKIWSIQKAESTMLVVALPLQLFATTFRPMIWVINWTSNRLLKTIGLASAAHHQGVYDLAEVRAMLNLAAKSGHLTARQKMLSERILDLSNLEVRHEMVPRMDVVYLSTALSLEDNLKTVREAGHSRFPLADPDLDHVIGIVHARTLLSQFLNDNPIDLKALVRPCPTVPDTQPLSRFIMDLQRTQSHCAVVVDEHGTMIGLAFLEDAIEQIVGPLYDEFDEKVSLINRVSPGVIELSGSVALPEAAYALEMEFEEEADTIGGLVVARLGRIPRVGDTLDLGPYKVTVKAMSLRRVALVRFEKLEPPPQDIS